MGFGGSLLEMRIAQPAVALAGFNLGVELGQLSVVAISWPWPGERNASIGSS